MTPVVMVSPNAKPEEKVDVKLLVFGIASFFFSIYFAIVFYRRYVWGLKWCDSLALTQRHVPRIEIANRTHRDEDIESAPRKATVVRFKVDGKVLGDDE
ncbi:hypothetical protein CRE_00328 [Caenorhabditis remanei]|uniref:Uncharacterized protein n=1 Tax=Caenorhabditis remanei TaxID=31234 RepID=E3LEI8_CAERE|nr:hypothetical protein CRE_00328 [Caenorhabditis remanei]